MSSDVPTSTGAEGAASAARVGKVVAGKYRLDKLLGEGGMGAVYAARNLWTDRRVAVKLLRPELLSKPDTVRRFLQEARSASKIEHPNIVQVFDMGQDDADGTLFIVQELLEGDDLAHRIKQHPRLSLGEISAILVPILDALEAAHDRGIIHRDLKPGNIFLSVRGAIPGGVVVPKLIDFGISKVLDDDGFQKTRTGTTVGTPYYMSPEQARGDSSLDVRTDVWSIAAVLFEILAGRGPFEASNYNQLIIKIVTERPPRIESLAPDTPKDLAEALHSALEPELDKRLPTIRAFRDVLLQCPSLNTPTVVVPRAIDPGSSSRPNSVATPLPTPVSSPTPSSVLTPSASRESPISHLDTLPSSLFTQNPELERSVPGHPVTVRPTLHGPSALAGLAGLGLFTLIALLGIRLTNPPPGSTGPAPPRHQGHAQAPDGVPRESLLIPPRAPPWPHRPIGPGPRAEREVVVPVPAIVVPDASVSRNLTNRLGSRIVHAQSPRDAGVHRRPTTVPPNDSHDHSVATNPGDNLRPSVHYPGTRPDAQ